MIPSFKLVKIGSPNFGFIIGFLAIRVNAKKANTMLTTTITIEPKTPIQPIVNPASAGPKTAATYQVELLQAAAFGLSTLGTINPNKLKTDGMINARIIPPKKTNA